MNSQNKSYKVLAVGLNPALQKILSFQSFEKGEVNRARNIEYIHGGKAANFVKAANTYNNTAVVYQFVGGKTGEKYCAVLAEEGIVYENVETVAETRICSTCIASDSSVTEIIEPSGAVTKEELDLITKKILNDLPKYDAIALCGTFPPGVDDTFYECLIKNAGKLNKPVLMDAHINIEAALKAGPDFLKINVTEFLNLCEVTDIDEGADLMFSLYPAIKSIALTDGPKESFLFLNRGNQEHKKFSFCISEVADIKNPIGAGDTVSAVYLSELLNNTSPENAFRKALAAGTASCLTKNNAEYSINMAKQLLSKIEMIKN